RLRPIGESSKPIAPALFLQARVLSGAGGCDFDWRCRELFPNDRGEHGQRGASGVGKGKMRTMTDGKTLLKIISHGGVSRIGVLGDYMLDEYVLGNVTRISPESPVPVVEHQSRYSTLGGAGNVVMNIRSLGGSPLPFGLVGNDIGGRKIKSTLQEESGVTAEHLFVDSSRPTTVKTRIIAQHQQLLRIDSE